MTPVFMRKLKAWMAINDKKPKEVTKSLGVSRSTLSLWNSGKARPTDANKEAIVRLTDGALTFQDFSIINDK